MIIELANGLQLQARDVFGGPKMVNGTIRDVLRIEFDTKAYSFTDLRGYFRNNTVTNHLYTYDENNKKTEIGNGYNIFVSISEEEHIVKNPPGVLAAEKVEDVYAVQIAQQTLSENGEWLEAHPNAY